MSRVEGARDDNRAYFRRRAPTYARGNWRGKAMQPQERAAIALLPQDLRIALDVGSGPGLCLESLSGHASFAVAVDFAAEMLGLRTHSHPCVVADGYSLPFVDESVDAIVMRMSIHYFQIPRLCVELARVLVPAGALVVLSIVPYGTSDTAWFNERHELKGKPGAHTPGALNLTTLLASDFTIIRSRSWMVRHSIDATGDDPLSVHVLKAPERIRKLYRVGSADGKVEYSVKWVALTYRRSARLS